MIKQSAWIAVAAFTAIFSSQAVNAQTPQLCYNMGNATMNGAYVATGTGTVSGVGPITVVALIVYNGDGTALSVNNTAAVNGTSSTTTNVTGTYTVNPDCTGTKTFGSGASAQHYNFVVTPDGNTIYWVITDNGITLSGTGVRVKY